MTRILITGATGNTGTKVVDRLVTRINPERIVALVRPQSDIAHLRDLGVRIEAIDTAYPQSYVPLVQSGDRFLGISNLRHCDEMLPHLISAGIGHAYCVTTTAVFSTYHSYSALYREIERRLLALPLDITLLRPSMIYGNSRDHNMHKLIRVLDRSPVFPVFGPGTALMQPVFVDDLADGIVAAVMAGAVGEFNLAGPQPLEYNEVLRVTAAALGRRVRLLHVPHPLAGTVVKVLERLPGFPVRHEQVMRLLEDKAFEISAAKNVLGYAPRPFDEGIALEVDEFRRANS